MLDKLPKISVVTACFNRAKLIRDAIQNILEQNYPNFEHIIVDGASTDGTLEVLKEYKHLRVQSEPDTGIYDAFNKGIKLAKGDIIVLLNSDDLLGEDTLLKAGEAFAHDPSLDMVTGGATVFRFLMDGSKRVTEEYINEPECRLTYHNVTLGVSITNARFFKKSLYEKAGPFPTHYKLASDRDFFIRVAMQNPKELYIPYNVYQYRCHDESFTITDGGKWLIKKLTEYLEVAETYLKKKKIPKELRKSCQLWHRRESIEIFLRYLKRGRLFHALKVAFRGQKFTFFWSFWLVIRIAKILSLKLKRGNR